MKLFDYLGDGVNEGESGWRRKTNAGYSIKIGRIKPTVCYGVFNNANTLLALPVSHDALDSGKTEMEKHLIFVVHLKDQDFFSLFVFCLLSL